MRLSEIVFHAVGVACVVASAMLQCIIILILGVTRQPLILVEPNAFIIYAECGLVVYIMCYGVLLIAKIFRNIEKVMGT